jgi:SAM-dependent methyltransferase
MIYKILPYFIFKKLFGDRKKFGLIPNYTDPDWQSWLKNFFTFYIDNQKGNIGTKVNHFGFKIVKLVDYTNKVVLEIGPGVIEHFAYNNTIPAKYILADINENFLSKTIESFSKKKKDFNIETFIVKNNKLPFEDNSIDIILSFHQLEHVLNISDYVLELKRILKTGGHIVGAVPTEGSVAWGLGRFLTSRRYVKRNFDFDYDKIICWEHPSFVNKINKCLEANFKRIRSIKKPLGFLPFDLNLSWSFIYQKLEHESF